MSIGEGCWRFWHRLPWQSQLPEQAQNLVWLQRQQQRYVREVSRLGNCNASDSASLVPLSLAPNGGLSIDSKPLEGGHGSWYVWHASIWKPCLMVNGLLTKAIRFLFVFPDSCSYSLCRQCICRRCINAKPACDFIHERVCRADTPA